MITLAIKDIRKNIERSRVQLHRVQLAIQTVSIALDQVETGRLSEDSYDDIIQQWSAELQLAAILAQEGGD